MAGAGIVGGTTLTSSASAQEEDENSRSGAYGNGNGLGAFLNEEAMFKEHPIWDGQIADRRGEDVVEVAVGAMTSVNPPEPEAPPEFPVAFAPRAVKISPGATVRWTWVPNPLGFPLPHDVASLVDEDGDPVVEHDGHPRFHSPHHQYKESPKAEEPDEEDLPTFEVEFTERGNHLYYCTPHGAPFEVCHDGDCIYNLVGMRGAVKVAGKDL